MPRLRPVSAVLLLALLPVLALASGAGVAALPADATTSEAPRDRSPKRAPQTSDGVPGEQAAPLPDAFLRAETWTTLQSYAVVPGVTFEQFTLTGPRGVMRGQLVRVDPAAPGVGLDLASGKNVASRHPLADLMDADAVIGVNGDFFDIRDTEAPLGVARDRQRGVLNGVASGWNSAFWVDRAGVPHISDLYADAVVRQRPGLDISTVNSPSVRPGGIGLYTQRWGTLRKYRVVDGKRRGVRMVVVRKGRVVSNRKQFPRSLQVRDLVLVGRGSGAGHLARLRAGQRIRAKVRLSADAAVAITGNTYILRDGVRISRDDKDLHPRTAIGIDHDTGQLLLVVVDGRQDLSRGATMREMAKLYERLGAEDALNLDGGGSSILLARQPDGSLGVLNSPSDGRPRPVPNGLQVTYSPAPAQP